MDLKTAGRGADSLVRRNLKLPAADGWRIPVRVTEAIGPRRGTLFFVNGTAGVPRLFDGMAAEAAAEGITTYSIGSRTHVTRAGAFLPNSGHRIHADDLDRVVTHGMGEQPGVPAGIAGVSLGATIVMHYNVTRNVHHLPVTAFNPVVIPKFLPPGDVAKVGLAILHRPAGDTLVDTPMKAGKVMSRNAGSAYNRHRERMARIEVPARIFDDVVGMTTDVVVRGRRHAMAPLHLVVSGARDDEVGVTAAARVVARFAAPRRLRERATVVPGMPHEASQEWQNRDVVEQLVGAVPLRR